MECSKLAISYWELWYNRNKVYHEGIRGQVQDVSSSINAYLLELKQLNSLSTSINIPRQTTWKPLEGYIVKVKFDASFNQQLHTSCLGVLARNREGLVMASCTFLQEKILNSTMAQARACLKAISFSEQLGFKDVCVEKLAFTVIKKLETRGANATTHGLAMEGRKYSCLMYGLRRYRRRWSGLLIKIGVGE